MIPVGVCAQINYIDILSLLNLKMEQEQLLEDRLRKSQSVGDDVIFQDFMDYAKGVRDEEEVLLYMQEQGIGTDHALYWVARMQVMCCQCRFVELVALLNSLKQRPFIQDPWEIDRYERQLLKHMHNILAMNCSGRRKAVEVSTVINGLAQERRKIGNIEIYVDPDCRSHYKMEDMAVYIEEKLKDYCQIERQDYRRMRERCPPSFIAKKEQRLMELAHEVLGKAARRSEQRRASLAPSRPSIGARPVSNKFEVESFNTPKANEPKVDSASGKEGLREKRKKDSSRDSIEILKSIRKEREKKSDEPDFKSPKFQEGEEDGTVPLADIPIGKIRSAPELDFFSFSFGKKQRPSGNEDGRMSQRDGERDNAFMFASFSQDSRFSDKQNINFVRKEDFELELIIKEIQRETYEKADARTFSSEIGSNQENEGFPKDNPEDREHRKPFQILLEAETQHLPPQQSMRLEELIDLDDEFDGNLQQMGWGSSRKRQGHGEMEFRSEGKRNMWEIRQENSHFFSESKHKHSRSK